MGSPYKLLHQKIQSVEQKVDAGDFEYKKLYPVWKIRVVESYFTKPDGSKPFNTVRHFYDEADKKFVYMPAAYDNLNSETLKLFRKDIEEKRMPNLAFYGKVGKANHLVLQAKDDPYDKKELENNMLKNAKILKRKQDLEEENNSSPKKMKP